MKRIILFIKKFFAWILSFFFDRNKTTKKKKKVVANVVSKNGSKLGIKTNFANRDEDMGESHIIDVYPYTEAKDLKSIDELIEKLSNKVEEINDEKKEEEIKVINEIKESITKKVESTEPINVSQEDIKEVLTNAIEDKEIHIDTDQKIRNIQKEIDKVLDKKINKHDKDIIEKAYYKYEKVNYVVATTMEIEELEQDIKDLQDSLERGLHKKSYYIDKVEEIEKKINRLRKINKNPKVYDELERLKEDFYTKSIDKYDLLYTKEVFINLDKQCENIIDIINEKEKEEDKEENKRKNELQEERQKREIEREEARKLKEQERERRQREKEELEDNIIKRYLDLRISNSILLTNALVHRERMKSGIIKTLEEDYDDYLLGETNNFNFDRNKQKTEVCKLYNNLLEVLCNEQKINFEPVNHINYQYQKLLEDTISTKEAVEKKAFEKTGKDVMMTPKSVAVSDKLDNELKKEKQKNREMGVKEKVLERKMKNT